MHPQQRFARPRRQHGARFATSLHVSTLLLSLVLLAASVLADSFPAIDFEGLGAVGVAGSFDGVSIWRPELALNESNTYDSNTSALILRDESGQLTKINETNPGGKIHTICQRTQAPNTVYVGGLFTQMGGLNASNVAAYDPAAKSWDTLNGGLDGEVFSLYCDDKYSLLYAGGSFVRPANVSNVTDTSRYLGNVASWNMTGATWLPVPFGGLNGTVHQITAGLNASTLRFAGSFDTAFSSSQGNLSISGTNTSASPLSVAYAPVPLGQSEFQGGPSSPNAAFADPAQILCPQDPDGENATYLFADNTTGRLTVRAFRNLPVSAIRLGNTFVDGRGTNEFNIVSIPDNTQLELLYLDPNTQMNVTCTTCPLFHDPAVPYQDFLIADTPANKLTNGVKIMTGLQFTATSWFGSGAGLHLMELLSSGSWAYAYEGYNRAACSSKQPGAAGVSQTSSSDVGEWYRTTVTTTTPATVEPVLAVSDDFSNLAAHQNDMVTFYPTVDYDGNYTVSMFVPGCSPGSQCDVRTDAQARVINNATVDQTKIPWTRVPQTNEQDAMVTVYSGPISKIATPFRPSVQLTIPIDAPKPAGSDRFTVYADRVLLTLLNSNETHQYYKGNGIGVFEYNVFDVAANNNSLAYGANSLLSNTTLIQQLLNATAVNSTLAGNVTSANIMEAANSTAAANSTMAANGTAATNGTASMNTTAPETAAQYIQTLISNLFSATQTLPNSTMTPLDFFSVSLESAGVLRNQSSSINAVQSVTNRTYVGGNFVSANVTNTTGFANFAAYDEASGGKAVVRLAGGGTNGVVNTLAAVGTFVFVGGDFTATTDNVTELPFIARYDSVANLWASMGSGVDGPVTSIAVIGSSLLVTGDFDAVNGTKNMGGLAVFETATNQWQTQTFSIAGTLSASSTDGNTTYIAGQVESVGNTPASAAISLNPPAQQGQYPLINPLNFAFPQSASAAAAAPRKAVPSGAKVAPNTRRSLSGLPSDPRKVARHASAAAVSELRDAEAKRSGLLSRLASRASSALQVRAEEQPSQLSSLFKRADAMDPSSLASDGDNEVLASAFWQDSDKTYWTVIGGNFTTDAGVSNLGIYNPSANQLEKFPTPPPDTNVSVVRAVYVDKDTLYAGGDGGILSFDLNKKIWNAIPPLTATAGTVLSVKAIAHRPDSNTIVVAGTFTNAGGAASLPCLNVCQWDSNMRRWMSVGNGVDGQIAAIDFAGSKANNIIAAGSMNLNGREVAVAQYGYDTNTWVPIGSVGAGVGQAPGPATAVSVDSLNINAIYLAGRSDAGTYPYFLKWDGMTFEDISSGQLLDSTGVAQLTFVGLTKPHADNPVMESNRMIVVSGALNMRDFGNVSSALFDGSQWTPFIRSTRPSGQPGIVRAFTRSVEVLNFSSLHHLAIGLVILISIALGLAVVFLLVLLGLIWALLFRRKNKGGVAAPSSASDETLAGAGAVAASNKGKQRPSSLLATLNKATENVMGEQKDVGYDDEDDYDYAKAAGATGLGAGAAAQSTSHGHAYTDSAAHGGGTLENSDETGTGTGHGAMSSQYHSDGQTGQSGVSRYYSGDEGAAPAIAGSSVAAGAAAAAAGNRAREGDAPEADGIEAHARYAFEATHSSELGVAAGERIWILDDQDEHWWLARNAEGRTGVLPASYVL